jgi:hypothetical protein
MGLKPQKNTITVMGKIPPLIVISKLSSILSLNKG